MCHPFRKYINKGLYSRKHRKTIADDFINEGIRQWEIMGRLSAKQAHDLREDYRNNASMDVYITGFGAHLLLKGITIFGDILALMNILGTSGVKFLEPLALEFLLIDFLPWPFNALAPLLLGPILRLIYVAYSKYRCVREGRKVPHGIAAIFCVGKFGVGNMAFPAQMLWSEKKFTMEYLLSKLGKKFPVFGGTDSRIEHWFIRRSIIRMRYSSLKTRILTAFGKKQLIRPYKPHLIGGRISGKSNSMRGPINERSINLTVISLYIILLGYIMIFRVFSNIIGTNEPEYYPMEMITTMCIVFSISIIYLISKEDKLDLKDGKIFYPLLLVTFGAYYLAENNWLLGRDALVGIIIYGGVSGLVLLFGLKYIYNIKKGAAIVFGLGIFLLCFGTFADATIDGYVNFNLDLVRVGLIEEICELFASVLFLHSFLLVYFTTRTRKPIFIKNRYDLSIMAMGAAVVGFGNSFLLESHNQPVPMERIAIGLVIITFALVIILSNIKRLTSFGIAPKPVSRSRKII
jgi:hypothetical protein